MNVYLKRIDIPDRCTKCDFVNSSDECILQGEDENFNADTWDDLIAGCPLLPVEDYREDEEEVYVLTPKEKFINILYDQREELIELLLEDAFDAIAHIWAQAREVFCLDVMGQNEELEKTKQYIIAHDLQYDLMSWCKRHAKVEN